MIAMKEAAAGHGRNRRRRFSLFASQERRRQPDGEDAGRNSMMWRLGDNHSAQQWQNTMGTRGWMPTQIDEAIQNGQRFPADNRVNAGNSATRYVHPTTGRSVVVDDVTGEVIHDGGDGFLY
jgi:hypothetical protein